MTFEELGAALCAERERRGLSLDDVAAHLKISTRLIQALESGDLSALPHPAYTKGFLRAYASYMALDPEAVAEVAHALQPAAATECTVMGGDEDLRSNPAILRHGARQGIAGWLRVFILLILVVVHRVVRPLRVLSGKAESFGRNLYTAPLPEDGPTEVREAARAFNKMQERIRAGVGQHERILAAVAHDLRTPLTRIRLRVESMDPASPLRAKLLGDIDILGGIMANSAELTRGSARDEAAVRMDMNALLDSLVSDRQDMGQDVSLEGSCARPWTVRPNSFRRCLSNLLDNALRYSGSVRIQLREKDDILQIDVLDDGPGIPPDMLEQVFEPFFRLDEARSPHTGGSGLGLSIARSMAATAGN